MTAAKKDSAICFMTFLLIELFFASPVSSKGRETPAAIEDYRP